MVIHVGILQSSLQLGASSKEDPWRQNTGDGEQALW